MRLPIARIVALFCVVALSACGTNPPPPAIHTSLISNYVLDSGDELRVTVFGQADLTNSYTVDKAGYIAMPLIGGVVARGRTSAVIEKDIADRLRKGFIRDPDVTVEVAKYRAIFIMGEVVSGGQYSYVPGLTVQQAVAIAGGFGPRAYRNDVVITRQKNGEVYNQPAVLSDPVYPGDTVTVRERFF